MTLAESSCSESSDRRNPDITWDIKFYAPLGRLRCAARELEGVVESMIARVWRGWTTPQNADTYQRVVSTQVLPEIAARNLPGYHGAFLLRRNVADETEFSTIMLFDSIDNVRQFTGDDYEVAHVPPDARAVLARFDERSAHYDVLQIPEGT
jgi:heme-degrading monooxygenase HmoA